MKLFGSLSEIVNLIFRKNSQAVTLRPNQTTTYTASRDIQLPQVDANEVVVGRSSADQSANRLKNKHLEDSSTAFVDSSDTTKQVKIDAAGTTGTSTTLLSSQTTNKTLTLPDATDTLVGKATTDILTNKTFDANGTGNSLSNVDTADLSAAFVLPVAKGGTNSSAALNNNRVIQSSGGAVVEAAAITAARALISDANGIPTQSVTTSAELAFVSGVTSSIQTQFGTKVTGPASAVDNTAVRFDGTTGKLVQGSSVVIDDANAITGVTQLTVDNIDINNNTISSTSGTIVLDPAGSNITDIKGAVKTDTELQLEDPGAGTNIVTIKAPTALAGNYSLTLPPDDGLSGQTLISDGNGVLTWASGSSGAGEINAILNPSIATDTTGWTAGTSHTIAQEIGANSPLNPVITTALKTSATTTASESSTSGAYYTISTEPTGLRNKKLKIEFYFTTEASQTWAVSIFSGSTRMSLSTDSSGASLLPAGTTGKYVTTFDADSSTSYTVHLTRTAGAGTAILYSTNHIVGPGIQPQGAVVGDWIDGGAITLHGSTSNPTKGTTARDKVFYRRVGTEMELRYEYIQNAAGSNGSGTYSLRLPSGFTIDTSKLDTTGTNGVPLVGHFLGVNQDTSKDFIGEIRGDFSGSPGEFIPMFYSEASGAVEPWASTGGLLFNASSIRFSANIKVPISEWAGAGTVNLVQNDAEYVYNTATADSDNTTSFAYGPNGQQFGSFTAQRTKRVRFQSPILNGDIIRVEITRDTGVTWQTIESSTLVQPHLTQNTATYGMFLTPVNSTDVDVGFDQYRLSTGATFGAAGAAWSGIAADNQFRWRIRKAASGQAIGFGIVTGTSAGLLPFNLSNLDDVVATREGKKVYAHGTTYNGGIAPTITLSSGGGTLSSVTASSFIPYQTQDSSWRMRFNVEVAVSSTARTSLILAINGVTFFASGGDGQAIAAAHLTANAIHYAYAIQNDSKIAIVHVSLSSSSYTYSGDVKLNAKPTWAY